MDNLVFSRKVDELGRLVLPIELRKILDIKEKTSLEISLFNNGIFIEKAVPSCVFCNSSIDLKSFSNKSVCKTCIKKLK